MQGGAERASARAGGCKHGANDAAFFHTQTAVWLDKDLKTGAFGDKKKTNCYIPLVQCRK